MKSDSCENPHLDNVGYDPETGKLWWNKANKHNRKGQPAGYSCNHGYLRIKVEGRSYSAHHFAWLKMFGVSPEGNRVKFKDGNRRNLKANNLIGGGMLASDKLLQPIYNITLDTSSRTFVLYKIQGATRFFLGRFKTLNEANAAKERFEAGQQDIKIKIKQNLTSGQWLVETEDSVINAKTKPEALAVALSVIIQLQSEV